MQIFTKQRFHAILKKGGILLAISAIFSKLLGLLRDRLLLDNFSHQQTDIILSAFRIPDFFFYLFVGTTLSTVFIPRLLDLKDEKSRNLLISSFFWKIFFGFGGLSLSGFLFANYLTPLFVKGLDVEAIHQIAHLVKYLFLSVFLLSLSGLFAAWSQAIHKFFWMSIAPLFYMGSICVGIWFWAENWGIFAIGYGAIIGSGLHLVINFLAFLKNRGNLSLAWHQPINAWQGFYADFGRRILNNSIFQINQMIDLLIASFLLTGAVTAFSLGSNLGHFLLSIIGFSLANVSFPKLTEAKHNYKKQRAILNNALKWIVIFVIPATLICALSSNFILSILFNLKGDLLVRTQTVFFWTVLSLPLACMIPILSRYFLANDDTKTPLKLSAISLFIATSCAALLALKILPAEQAILGLALGNFLANTLSASLLLFFIYVRGENK